MYHYNDIDFLNDLVQKMKNSDISKNLKKNVAVFVSENVTEASRAMVNSYELQDAIINSYLEWSAIGTIPKSIIIMDHGPKKINAIKVSRDLFGIGLKEAKDFVEGEEYFFTNIDDDFKFIDNAIKRLFEISVVEIRLSF